MRLPSLRDLTDEQKQVYLYAPTDRNVLVAGPPGTGKTVIACFRALELRKKKQTATLTMFNRVLKRFAARIDEGEDVGSETFHSWFRNWWLKSGLPPHPAAGPVIVLCPFEEKNDVKGAGAKWSIEVWRPGAKKPGAWTVDFDEWTRRPNDFARWKSVQNPPMIDGDPLSIDWGAARDHLLAHLDRVDADGFDVGVLLIDEGQDFPPAMYQLLKTIADIGRVRAASGAPLRCFVLGDENQRLTDRNSTLAEIASALAVADDCRFGLHDNFRNTLEIATLARHFYADVGHLPRLPKRRGELPKYLAVPDRAQAVDFIARWLRSNPRKESAVICFRDATRQALFEEFDRRKLKLPKRDLRIQTYAAKMQMTLEFDRPDTVSILNVQSCKGLEFDCVFLVELQDAYTSVGGDDAVKMKTFVAASRAREELFVVDIAPTESAPHLALLPGDDVLKRLIQDDDSSEETDDTPQSSDDWIGAATRAAKAHGVEYADLRNKNGCFWVYGDQRLKTALEPLGFRHKNDKGWWRV